MGGKHKIRDDGHAMNLLVNDGYYGGHEVYSGTYKTLNGWRKWTQLGDDGENNGEPAADISVEKGIIKIHTGDPKLDKSWKVPTHVVDMKKIAEEVDEILDKYYSQWIEQPRFVQKR